MAAQPSYLRYFQEPRGKQTSSPTPSSIPPTASYDSTASPIRAQPTPPPIAALSEPTEDSYDYRRSSATATAPSRPSAIPPSTPPPSGSLVNPTPQPKSSVPLKLPTNPITPSALSQPPLQDEESSPPRTPEASSPPQTTKDKNKGLNWLKKKQGADGVIGKDRVSLVNPQRTLSKELKNLVNNPDYCDVVFILEDKPLYAHRCILASRSQKFQQLFNNIKEARAEINVPNIRYSGYVVAFALHLPKVSRFSCYDVFSVHRRGGCITRIYTRAHGCSSTVLS